MRRFWVPASLILLIAALAAAPLAAGVVVEVETRDLTQPSAAAKTGRMTVEGRQLRMDLDAAAGSTPEHSMIFRGESREMVVVDHSEKAYFVIDEETVSGLANQMSAAMQQMEQAIAQLPPEQRAMAEKMMKGKLPQQQAAKPAFTTEVRPTSERAERQGYPCRKFEVLRNGQVVRELWVADWGTVGLAPEDLAVVEDLGAFFEKAFASIRGALPGVGLEAPETFKEMSKLGGVPVEAVEYRGGKPVGEMKLRSIQKDSPADAALFEPPEGYRQRALGM